MLKPALRPPMRAPMRSANSPREGVGVAVWLNLLIKNDSDVYVPLLFKGDDDVYRNLTGKDR